MCSLRLSNCAAFLLFIFFLSSCSAFRKKNPEENSVARAYGKFLSRDEVLAVIPPGATAADSAKIAEGYISNWLNEQAVLHKAESNIENDSVFSSIKKQMDDYRNSLIRFAYEKELVSQKLDTAVSLQEVEDYYNNNKSDFELKDNIIKVIYLKVNRKSPKLDLARNWYKSESGKDKKLLEDYCHQYAENFFLDDSTWLLFDDLLKEIPIRTYDKDQFLKNNRFIEAADSSYIYLVNIKGFKIKDSISPLVFEHVNIVNIILNKRKLKLIEEMEKTAYDEALRKNDIETFDKK